MAVSIGTRAAGPDASPAARAGSPRILSLDWVRGLMLVASVGVNIWIPLPSWFNHAPWVGVRPMDWIFPVFVTLSGCGLAFAYHRRVEPVATARRVVVLIACGLAYNALAQSITGPVTWSNLRWTGPLQLYAALVLLMALGHLLTRDWRAWAGITFALAVGHTVLLSAYAQDCPGEALAPACNPSRAVDAAVLGGHMYRAGQVGHDPEGVVAVLGALICCAAGATVGHAMLSTRRRGVARSVLPVVGLAGLLQAGAVLAGAWVPAMKRLWTAPFALHVSAAVALALLAGHLLLDRPGTGPALRALTWPNVAMGRNSLFVYFGSHALTLVLLKYGKAPDGKGSLLRALQDHLVVDGHRQLPLAVLAVLAWASLAAVLHWRRIYLRP